ncbi:hypothetical protein ACFL0I_02665 [Gemmatimonadota bacterium]
MNSAIPLRKHIIISILFLVFYPLPGWGQEAQSEEARIRSELEAHYQSFEGPPAEQTWEKWQSYFLRSPNIGNLYGSNMRVGWEAYEEASLTYFDRPQEERPAARFEELNIHVIDDRTAWVTGVYVRIWTGRTQRMRFYDVLISTPEGWRTVFSYVERGV